MKERKPMIDDLFTPLSKSYRPTDADRQRLRGKLLASITATEASASASAHAARWPGRLGVSRRAAWMGSAALVLAGMGLTVFLTHESASTRSRTMPAAAPASAEPPASVTPPTPSTGDSRSIDVSDLPSASEGARPATARPRAAATAPSTAASNADALERETRLWRSANRARNEGQWGESLRLLDQHALEFPSGVLANERTVERIVVLCHMGRTDEAAREAKAFLATHPTSLLRDRVESTCGGSRRPPSPERQPAPSHEGAQ